MVLTGCIAMATIPARAQKNSDGTSSMYFVPGGRIGFKKPDEIQVWSNRWILLSRDHTFSAQVRETVRLNAEFDGYMWDKDDRAQRIPTSFAQDGFEVRRFRDLRYDPSPDYASESMVLRDAHWMGEVQVSNHRLGLDHPGGQNARWKTTMDDILNSIVVRPQPTVADALAELRLSLDTIGLNPRLIGEELILSLYTPRNGWEARGGGANHFLIRTSALMLAPLGDTFAEREQFIEEQFAIHKETAGGRVLTSASGRGILADELKLMPGLFSTTLTAFGRTGFWSLRHSMMMRIAHR
jgi:hypothetical protein